MGDRNVVDGMNLAVPAGEVHAIMGAQRNGKTSLSKAIAGHPDYKICSGEVLLNGENIVGLPPDEIARKGFFLAFQYPVSIPLGEHCELHSRVPERASAGGRNGQPRGILQKALRKNGRA